MSEFDKNMSVILETEFVEEPVKEAALPVKVQEPQPDATEDFDYSRKNYYDLIERGSIALDGILEVAKESQHPRAYEVASAMMKNLADMTDKLMILQKQRKELGMGSETPKSLNIDKAVVFTGSTADLLQQIKANGRNEILHNIQDNKQY